MEAPSFRVLCTLCAMLIAALSTADARATTINFDGTGAPCLFSETAPLTEYYAGLGVHFSGPAAGQGGAILDECGGFGVDAYSGEAFLAFNEDSYAIDPETITFDALYTDISIYAAGGWSVDTFLMEGYNGSSLLDSDTVTTQGWGRLSISSSQGFDRVVLTRTGADEGWVYDDLTFVPEPTTLALLVLGGAALARRRS